MLTATGSRQRSRGNEKLRIVPGSEFLAMMAELELSGVASEVLMVLPEFAESEEEPSRSTSSDLMARALWNRAAALVSLRCNNLVFGWSSPSAPTSMDTMICRTSTSTKNFAWWYLKAAQRVTPMVMLRIHMRRHKETAFFLIGDIPLRVDMLATVEDGGIVVGMRYMMRGITICCCVLWERGGR